MAHTSKHLTENDFFREKFNEKLDFFSSQNHSVILAYDGVINQSTISKLESEIEEKITQFKFSKSVTKKIFFISVELLQNLFVHGAEDHTHTKHNFIIISKHQNDIIITTANLVYNKDVEKVKKIFETINSFSNYDELKKYYLERLEKNDLSDKGGAGLGFITIGLKSQPPMKYEFKKINNQHSYFELSVKLIAND